MVEIKKINCMGSKTMTIWLWGDSKKKLALLIFHYLKLPNEISIHSRPKKLSELWSLCCIYLGFSSVIKPNIYPKCWSGSRCRSALTSSKQDLCQHVWRDERACLKISRKKVGFSFITNPHQNTGCKEAKVTIEHLWLPVDAREGRGW